MITYLTVAFLSNVQLSFQDLILYSIFYEFIWFIFLFIFSKQIKIVSAILGFSYFTMQRLLISKSPQFPKVFIVLAFCLLVLIMVR